MATNDLETSELQPLKEESSIDPELLLEQMLDDPVLPSPPLLAMQLVELVSDPNCEVHQIAALLNKDPGLCAKLLKTLNSCVYGLSQPVSSVSRAVMILGLHPLRSLVLGLSLPAMQQRLVPDAGLTSFWHESVSGAIIAQELAKRSKELIPEDVFIASLLRDVGMSLLQRRFPKVYEPMWVGRNLLTGAEQCAWELLNLGIDHARVSAGLLKKWRLPDEIVELVRYHHTADKMISPKPHVLQRARLLDVSSRLARLRDTRNASQELETIQRLVRDHHRMNLKDLEEFLTGVWPKIAEFARVLDVNIGTCPQYTAVLSAGCAELVRLSIESSRDTRTVRGATEQRESPSDKLKTLAGDLMGKAADSSLDFLRSPVNPDYPTRIDGYEILEMIGRGGMGVVMKAIDLNLERNVALKFLKPELASSESARQMFAREARTAASILHEHVVTIFAVNKLRTHSFLVMEYIRGKSLQEWLDSGRVFTVPEIVRIGAECALGLAAAHRLNVVHRDIKPGNVLLEEGTDRVRITDFGLARAMDDSSAQSHDGSIRGTPNYMSPEQIEGTTPTHSTDLFSLGSLLYTLCVGKAPFQSDSLIGILMAVKQTTLPPAHEVNPAIPKSLGDLIAKLHAKNPKDRIGSAAQVAELLRGLRLGR